LIILGDQAVQKIVTAIYASPEWSKGHSAIVVLWDENDYAVPAIINQVAPPRYPTRLKSTPAPKNPRDVWIVIYFILE
jgi:hypothetical protein